MIEAMKCRARRPQPLRRRSRHDAGSRERAARRRLDRTPARHDRSGARVDADTRSRAGRRHRVPVRRRPRRTARQPDPDQLHRRGRRAARRRLGHQPPEPRLVVPARRDASERPRRRQAADAHADPRARVPRRAAVAGVRRDGRPHAGADPSADAHAHRATTATTRRPRSPRRAGRSIPTTGTCRSSPGSTTTCVDGLRARGHDVRISRAYDDGMGHAHAIELLEPGYRGRDRSSRRRRGRAASSRDR